MLTYKAIKTLYLDISEHRITFILTHNIRVYSSKLKEDNVIRLHDS